MFYRRSIVSLLAFAFVLAASSTSYAQVGRSKGYQHIKKGTFDLSFDNALTYKSVTNAVEGGDLNQSAFDFLVGVTPKYFLINNYYVGVNLNFAFATSSSSFSGEGGADLSASDVGFIGFVDTGYYLRLGNSFFLAPKIGAGYYVASRERPVEGANLKTETSLSAVAGKVGMDAVFYAGSQFNLRAGVSLIYRTGSEELKDDDTVDPIDFTVIDAFYNVGLGYTF